MVIPSPPPLTEYITPVTQLCIEQAASVYKVPSIIILSVMAQESGKAGKYTSNNNNTRDYGPMAINSSWLPKLYKNGITESSLLKNGCLNVLVGTAILRKYAVATRGNWWQAVGNYHSKTEVLHKKYLMKVADKADKILKGILTVADILKSANSS
jgi:soluble lytic murein transglycosylase-like protein